jgi:hypothetical protein
MIFKELNEFKKEFKRLSRKYNSLKLDFEDLKKVLEVDPKLSIFWKNWVKKISWLWKNIKYDIFKIKKFRCASISWTSKDSWLRIIYTYIEEEEKIEFQMIEFIEIFKRIS